MPDPNTQDPNTVTTPDPEDKGVVTPKPEDKDLVSKLVQERLDAELKDIKDKLDKAFKQRDEALKKAAELEQKEKEASIRKMEEEGKHKEAYEARLADSNARIAALEKRNTELSRDVSVRDALKGLAFRNETASEMAYKVITEQLVQNDSGQWVHRSGVSIRDFVGEFAKSEEQSFLFKPKSSSGAGTNQPSGGGTPDTKSGKSLFNLSQEEVLRMAAEGKFGDLNSI
jgi:vacuolar-type H+-ATPase subunit E/Vma4